jgi:Mce-associated membrane protein
MPPPPRRRRPVQPATRVRLPRAARPRGGPASEEAPELAKPPAPETEASTAAGEKTARASVLTDEPAGGADTAQDAEDAELADAGGAAEPAGAGDTDQDNDTWDADDDEHDADEAAGDADTGGGKAGGKAAGEHVREPLLLPVSLAIVAVALGGLAVWFGLKSGGAATGTGFGTGTGNAAVADRAATAEVTHQIDNAVDTIFSYNYADTARTENAAKELLTGAANAQYATLFKVVRQQAPKEKLVLTTTVTNSGVESLNGDTARLLIFANQKDTGAAKGSTTEAGAMFAVTAVKQNGQWKIENIDTFSAPG